MSEKKKKKIRIASISDMVMAPDWVKHSMINIELGDVEETTEVKVFWGVKKPILGHNFKLVEVIEVLMTSNKKSATWLRDNLLRDTNQLIFLEKACCERILVSE